MLRTAFLDDGVEWSRKLSRHALQVAFAQFHPFLYHLFQICNGFVSVIGQTKIDSWQEPLVYQFLCHIQVDLAAVFVALALISFLPRNAESVFQPGNVAKRVVEVHGCVKH